MANERSKLMQFYTLPNQHATRSDIREEFSALRAVLREDDIKVLRSDPKEFTIGKYEGVMLIYACKDKADKSEGTLSYISVKRPIAVQGMEELIGLGVKGIGNYVDTIRVKGKGEMFDRLVLETESIYSAIGGQGWQRGEVEEFVKKADAVAKDNGHPLELGDYLYIALELEHCKGPFSDERIITDLETRHVESWKSWHERGVIDSMRDVTQEMTGFYGKLLERLLESK